MRPRPPLPPGPYLVVGLARSGVAAALALHARKERVIAVDAGAPAAAQTLLDAGIEVHLRQDGLEYLSDVATVVKSPGVPREAAVVRAALQRSVTVLGELELAWRMLANQFIAITGTNGKSTTVELVGHIHRKAGLPVAVAGNIGVALSGLIGVLDEQATVVCETSSFQLQDTLAFAPEAALVLNITPDHLDRHHNFEDYRAAKLQIFAHRHDGDLALAPCALEIPSSVKRRGPMLRFGDCPQAVVCQRQGSLFWREQPLIELSRLSLRGAHNVHNAMAAAAVCLERGVPLDAVRAGLADFPGVAHRLQQVAELHQVAYINDSKATNVASTIVALACFPRAAVHLILGGQGKGQDFAPLREGVAEHCQAVYLIGQDAPSIAAALDGLDVEIRHCGDLGAAVERAHGSAAAGEVVLLSPGCASFDQFSDFEARGERFSELVAALDGGAEGI